MIALPVLGVTAADVVIQTSEVSGTEAIERRLGTADARVRSSAASPTSRRPPTPTTAASWSGGGRAAGAAGPSTTSRPRWAATSSAVELVTGGASRSSTDAGRPTSRSIETDLDLRPDRRHSTGSPTGGCPSGAGEVVVNGALADAGLRGRRRARGRERPDPDGRRHRREHQVPRATRSRSRRPAPSTCVHGAAATPGSSTPAVTSRGTTSWPSTTIGATVLSRAVLLDPPPDSALDPELG